MIRFSKIGNFSCGVAAIQCKSRWGFLNSQGVFLIPCKYKDVQYFSEGKAAVRRDKLWSYIDLNDETITDFCYNMANPFSEGKASIKKGKFWGLIDDSGNELIEPKYKFISSFSENVVVAKIKDKYGFINEEEAIILPFIYDEALSFISGIAYVRVGTKHGFINKQGEFVLEFQKNQTIVEGITNEYILVKNQRKVLRYDWSIYNNEGKLIIESLPYIKMELFHEGRAPAFERIDKVGLIDVKGNLIVPCDYDYVSPIFCGLSVALKKKKIGYIDRNNQIIIPFKYSSGIAFSENLTCVNTNRWNALIIDVDGNVVLKLKKELTVKNIFLLLMDIWGSI